MTARGAGIEVPTFADAGQRGRWWQARRTALAHTLRLCLAGPSGDALVLRGSVPLTAWLGAAAREPGDLDWVVSPSWVRPVDTFDPHPYVSGHAQVQHWPEVFAGAGAGDLWCDEEFDTRGVRACPPPEGTHWLREEGSPDDDDHGLSEDGDELLGAPDDELRAALARCPDAGGGVVLDGNGVRWDPIGSYGGGDYAGMGGVRLTIPWHADGLPGGTVAVDYALGEPLPEPPRWTVIPGADGPPVAVSAVTPALSLAWKLHWLRTDAADERGAGAKDLYDAVLLAESPHPPPTPELLRRVLGTEPVAAGEIGGWAVPDWARFRAGQPGVRGGVESWLGRLARALEPG
ncbi:nucleotidyl transferase AbiEii/AbiGii toxin family protein [Embleya sp. AB8]|uniref:nucleotidyl transferase AbiEii/AbiGii toxin family protein n=1 Tax=Embleya sp. AB8 TaxID=3156304 RepID=UPI003C74CEE6